MPNLDVLTTYCVCFELREAPFLHQHYTGFNGNTGLSVTPRRPACPSRAYGWSSLTTLRGFPCCVRFPYVLCCRHYPDAETGRPACSFTQPYQPSPIWQSGRPAHRPFRRLLGVHSRYGLHTRAVTVFRDPLHRRLQPLRYLHDCSGCFPAGAVAGRGLHPLGKAPPLHGARHEDTRLGIQLIAAALSVRPARATASRRCLLPSMRAPRLPLQQNGRPRFPC